MYQLHESLGYKLSYAARLQERRLDDELRKLGLTRTMWCILLAAGVERLSKPSDIATFIGIDRTATSRALREMEAVGMVRRATGTGDRRTTKVSLTPKGRGLIARSVPLALARDEKVSTRLSKAEVSTLRQTLEKLIHCNGAESDAA